MLVPIIVLVVLTLLVLITLPRKLTTLSKEDSVILSAHTPLSPGVVAGVVHWMFKDIVALNPVKYRHERVDNKHYLIERTTKEDMRYDYSDQQWKPAKYSQSRSVFNVVAHHDNRVVISTDRRDHGILLTKLLKSLQCENLKEELW